MIVGVTGHARHGKDSIGNILRDEYGFRKYAFADQLKSMALALNPLIPVQPPRDDLQEAVYVTRLADLVSRRGWETAKMLDEVRRFLQVLGTEGVRGHLGEDAWIRALERRIDEDAAAEDASPNIVITDVRFPNEAKAIRDRGGEIWRVRRYGFDNGLGTDHDSERFVDYLPAKYTLVAKDLSDLRRQVMQVMERSYIVERTD